MDNAVALVQSYLYLNGYLTVAEYPVLQMAGGRPRMATDIDLLALRLPRAGGLVTACPPRPGDVAAGAFRPDEALDAPEDRADFLIGEVKEGRAVLNRGATEPDVPSAVLSRFVLHVADDLPVTVEELRRSGRSIVGENVQARLVAFGVADEVEDRGGYRIIPLSLVLERVRRHLDERWDVLRHAQIKDPAVGFLATLKKAGLRDRAPSRG